MARKQMDPIIETLRALARTNGVKDTPHGLASVALEASQAIQSFTPNLEAVREEHAASDPLTRAKALLAAAKHSSNSRVTLANMAKRATVTLAEHAKNTPDHLLGLVDAGLEVKVASLIRREEREIRLRSEALANGMAFEEYMQTRRQSMRERRLSRMTPEQREAKKTEEARQAAVLMLRKQAIQEAQEGQERRAKELQKLEWDREEIAQRREALRKAESV
jgi:hypothetical protein